MQQSHVLAVAAASVLFAACGGSGGGSGAIPGLQGAEQVTIVTANQGSAAMLDRGSRRSSLTDYQATTTRFWVRDRSMETLDTVNMILGFLHETNYWDDAVVNQGPYRALVKDEQRGEGGDGRGNTGPTFVEWVIDSSRASASAPQIVKFWLSETAEGVGDADRPPAIIYGHLQVDQEPSTGNTLGVFTLHFKELLEDAPAGSIDTQFEGYLQSVARTDGQSEVLFYMSHGDPDGVVAADTLANRQRVHVIGDPTTDSGRAYAEYKKVRNDGGVIDTEQGEFNLQFNSSYLAMHDLVADTYQVLDRNDFDTYVFNYGLFDRSSEAKVALQSGFPLETVAGDRGWVGFHGLWFGPSTTIADGQTLVRHSYTPGTPATNYTAVVVPGRLEKRTRHSFTVGDIDGEELDTFDPTAGQEILAVFSGTTLLKVAVRSGMDWNRLGSPVDITGNYTTGMWLHFYSQARGSVELIWPATLTASTPAFGWSQETINANSPEVAGGSLTLHGYFHQLRALITSNQANYSSGESAYWPDASDPSTGNQDYSFDPSTLMLTLGGQPVRLADGVSVGQGPGMFGFDCGPLFASPLATLGDAASQTTTYQWTTGANDWNQLRTVKNSGGAFVQFDQPLSFTYTHHETGSPYDGRSFQFEWDGSNLGGVPSLQSTTDNRWYPLFNIPSGTVLTTGGHDYLVKQLEGEQVMVAVGDPAGTIAAQGFDLTTSITQPDASGYADPAIGTRPTVTTPPLFVGGVKQN